MTDSAARAFHILRDGSQFGWHVVPLLLLVLYVYANEIQQRNWNVVFAGLALWGVDWFNEIWNALVLRFTGRAPVWGAPGGTAYLILIGLNIEICLMFAVMGVVVAKTLPCDRHQRLLGLPNRWVLAVGASLGCVLVELLLNAIGALTWDYWWWNARMPWLIFLFGYLTFFVVAFWVHDMGNVRRQATAVGSILAFDLGCLMLFGRVLGWI